MYVLKEKINAAGRKIIKINRTKKVKELKKGGKSLIKTSFLKNIFLQFSYFFSKCLFYSMLSLAFQIYFEAHLQANRKIS